MSSWFGSGLSQITGQISNFTKEVLEEGTEEVDDAATQLRITRSKFAELDNYCQAQKSEIEHLKATNDELREKLEASELQIKTLSNQYRVIIENKEKELNDIKLQHNELCDLHGATLEVSPATSPSGSSIPHSFSVPSFPPSYQGDEHDFDDVITSQYEINRLRSENRKLEAQVQHWKERCQSETSRVAGEESGEVHSLQQRIKELQQQYDDEIDQHQKELAALQDVHVQKLATVKHKYKEEITHLHEQLSELQDQVSDTAGCSAKMLEEFKNKVQHLERVNEKLTIDLELTHAADREKARCLDDLSKHLNSITEERDELLAQRKTLQKENEELLEQLDAVLSERRSMSLQFNAKIKEQSTALQDLQNTRTGQSSPRQRSPSYASSTPERKRRSTSQLLDSNDLSEIQSDLAITGESHEASCELELDDRVKTLLKQIADYQDEIRQFEMVKSDWQMEKEALEDVLLRLREQLRDRDEQLTVLHAQKGLLEIQRQQGLSSRDHSSGADAAELTHQVELLMHEKEELEKEHSSLQSEKDKLLQLVENYRKDLKVQEAKYAENLEKSLQQVAHLEDECSVKDQMISELRENTVMKDKYLAQGHKTIMAEDNIEESSGLEKSMEKSEKSTETLASQETRELEKVYTELRQLEERHKLLVQQLEEKTSTVKEVVSEKAALIEENNILNEKVRALLAEKENLAQEIAELSEKNEEINRELTELKEERDGLDESLNELDNQHEAAMAQILEARDKLLKENTELKSNIATLELKLREANKQLEEVQMLADDFMKLKAEQKKVSAKLNDLQLTNDKLADVRVSLEEERALLKNQLHQVAEERNQLQEDCDKLQQQATSATSQVELLRKEITGLQEEVVCLRQHTALSRAQLQDIEKASSTCHLEQHKMLEVELAKLREAHTAEISDLRSEVKDVLNEKMKLEKELEDVEQKRTQQKEQFEQYHCQLKESQQLDNGSLQQEYQQQLSVLQEKERLITDLQQQLKVVQTELVMSRETLESTLANQPHEMKKEISCLKDENRQLMEKVKEQQDELDKLTSLEKKYEEVCKENTSYLSEIKHLKQLVEQNESRELEKSVQSGSASVAEVERQIDLYKQQTQEQERKLVEQEQEIKSLKGKLATYEEKMTRWNQNVPHDGRVEELRQVVAAGDETNEATKHLKSTHDLNIHEKTNVTISNREKLKQVIPGSSMDNLANVIQNGDIDDDPLHSSGIGEEIKKLKCLVSEKDSVISQLNDNNSSLLKLLEERSQNVYGDQTLLDIHRLENEAHSLRMEKDQIMSILNEKTRECSSLKSEVHRLMNVISAEKTALSKLQQDNQELIRTKDVPSEDAEQDMKQEAIKKLSQIIRDKDMEIEALSQKNQTLLQVLQDSAQESSQITSLIHEKDNLIQQISLFQKDREQIISMLNAKHVESVTYHEEVQRLSRLLTAETEKHEQLQTYHASLEKQFEDKQHALVKMQNEMLNYKKKYGEVNAKLKELEQQKNRPGCEQQRSLGNNEEKQDSTFTEQHELQQSSLSSFSETAEELDDLRRVIKSHEEVIAEKDRVIDSREQVLKEKEHAIWEKDVALNEKDKQLADLRSKLHKVEEVVHSKDSELSNCKKQSDNLSFQLKGIQMECGDLRHERDQLYERSSVLQQELGSLKELNNRLTMSLHDKEFEIRSLNENMNTMSKLREEQGEDNRDEMQGILKEIESQQKQAQMFKQERDQSMLALQQQQTENQHLKNEIQRLKEKGEKSLKELERLRGHLLVIEENYTEDALAAEEREKELRNKLAAAEEKAYSSSAAVQSANQQAMKQVESLQTQLHVMAEQRDDALLQLSNTQETASQYLTSLQNLQMVLEQFQMEKESQQNAEIEKYQKEIVAYKNEIAHLQDQICQLQAQVDETTDALEAAQRLSEQLDHKEEMIAALREEVQLRESELTKMEAEIQKLSSSTESKVDKVLMKNLILGYFHTPPSTRADALRLIGRMLDFSKAEMEQVGADGRRGWLGGLFRKQNPTPPGTPQSSPNKSFSELFVNFLERESSPQPSIRLPAERMVVESQRRHSQSHQAPVTPTSRSDQAFNPFSAPINATLPLHIRKDADGRDLASPSQHPLIKPVTPSLPLFAAMVPESSTNLLMASSGGSTLSSGAILRDVLQQ